MATILRRKKWGIIIVFLSPAAILYGVLKLYPYVRGLETSLYRWSGLTTTRTFVGLGNFSRLINDREVFTYLGHNGFIFFAATVTMILGLIIAAILVRSKVQGKNFFRVVFFFPNVMSVSLVAALWSLILSPNFGLLNAFLRAIGLDSLAMTWLGPVWALRSVGAIYVWAGFGWFMLLYIAGIQNIPRTLYEAAEIDGASSVYVFFRITVPLIWELVRTTFVFNVMGALNQFALVYVIFEQTPNPNTDMIANYFYWQAFTNYNFGYAASIVTFTFLITLVVTILTWRITKAQTVSY
jgi:N-acetylglucosamine transport system permease protein